jgi:hypothetical protein
MPSPDIFFQRTISKLQMKTTYRDSIKSGLIVNNQKRNEDNLTIVFPPWGTSPLLLSWIVKAVSRNSSILGISPSKMLTSDPEESLHFCTESHQESLSLIKEELDSNDYEYIRVVGLSIGTGLAVLTSIDLLRGGYSVDRLDLVSPGSSMASAFWSSKGTKALKKAYLRQGYNLKSLEEVWSPVKIIDLIDRLKDVPTKVTYSKADIIIRPSETKRLIAKLKRTGTPNLKVKKNYFLGHYLTLFWVWATWRIRYRSSEKI